MSQFIQDHIDAMLRQVPANRRRFLKTLLLAGAGIGAAMMPASEVLAQNAGGGGKGKGGKGKGDGGAGGGKGKGGGAGGGGKGKGGGAGKGKGGGAGKGKGGGGGTAAGAVGKDGTCKGGDPTAAT